MLKDSFLHLPIFILIFVVVFCAIVGSVILASWAGMYNPAVEEPAGRFANYLREAAGASLTVSVLISLFLLFGRIQKRPGNRLLSFLLPLLVCLTLIAAGIAIIHGPPGSAGRPEITVSYPFVPGKIHSIESGLVYVDGFVVPRTSDGIRLEGVVRYQSGRMYYDRVAAATLTSMFIPGATSRSAAPIAPRNPIYRPMFEAPDILRGMIADVGLLNDYLLNLRSRSPERFIFAVLSVSFFAMSCVTFLRLTKWPLFNALFTLALFRGIFLLIRFFDSNIGREVSSLVPNEQISLQMPSLVYFALGLLFIAFNLLFVKQANEQTRN